MKSLTSFVHESVKEKTNWRGIRANEYLNTLNKDNKFTDYINSLVDQINKNIDATNKIVDAPIVNENLIQSILEVLMTKSPINGFEFERNINDDEKANLICKKVGAEVSSIKTYDIELVATSDNILSKEDKNPKNAFYILIKYDSDKSGKYITKVNNFEAYFGYLTTSSNVNMSFNAIISKNKFIKLV